MTGPELHRLIVHRSGAGLNWTGVTALVRDRDGSWWQGLAGLTPNIFEAQPVTLNDLYRNVSLDYSNATFFVLG